VIVIGCLSVFDCEETIDRTLKSIEPFVDRIIAIDGSFEGFTDHVASEDETMTKLRNFPKVKTIIKPNKSHPFKSEVHKRNYYMLPQFYMTLADKEPKTPHWLFIIDGDEYVQSGVDETLQFLENSHELYHAVKIVSPAPWDETQFVRQGGGIRLLRYVKGMRYVDNHYTIQYPNGSRVRNDSPAMFAPLVIIHDDRKIRQSYKDAMTRYNREVRPRVERLG